jgi:uncharacterized membrane protein
MSFLAAYLISGALFVVVDFAWLVTMVPRLYRPALGPLLLDQPNMTAAVLFYLAYPVGLAVFAVLPGIQEQSLAQAGLRGALFGFLAYATYNLTNLATLRQWSVQVATIDSLWGAFASAFACAGAAAMILKWMARP